MKQFVLGALVATAVLGAAGFAVMKEPVAGAKRNVPLKLSDLTLDRAYRFTVPIGPNPVTLPSDPSQGFVITEVTSKINTTLNDVPGLFISINGLPAEVVPAGTAGTTPVQFRGANPPIVVRPGDTVAFWQGTSISAVNYTIGGYFVYPGEV